MRGKTGDRRARWTRLGALAAVAGLVGGCTINTYVNRASSSVPSTGSGTAFVTVGCRDGDNATGGGARVNPSGTGATIRTSEPDPPVTLGTPSGWRAGFDDAAGHEIEVFVVCAGSP